MTSDLTLDEIRSAQRRIAPFVRRTPIMTSSHLDARAAARLYFKCENLQKGGAFKARGAHNAVYQLSEHEAGHGVVTHSSGNHGAAVALAARSRGIAAHIVMPSNVAAIKKAAVLEYGANVIECEPTLSARDRAATQVVRDTGGCFIHPFDDYRVMAGQGTAALEMLEDCAGLDLVLVPVGGGGLLGGTAVAVKESRAADASGPTAVIGVEPELADDVYRSFRSGVRVAIDSSTTIADGLRGSLGERNFALLMRYVDDVVTVSDAAIIAAMRVLWERMKIVVEPSAAVPLAAILDDRIAVKGLRVGIILTGGNVDLDALPW